MILKEESLENTINVGTWELLLIGVRRKKRTSWMKLLFVWQEKLSEKAVVE